jgi:glycerol kinase
VRLVHHVFRPDGSPQRIRTGAEQPLHATALGKCLLAFAPVALPRVRELALTRYTGRTCTTPAALEAHLALARRRGWATDGGECEFGVGGAAVALRTGGGLVVGALAISGPAEELFGGNGDLRPRFAEQLVAAGARCRRRWTAVVNERVVAAIDQGTTSTRCLLFNRAGRMLAVAQREHRQHYPRPGWVEHDAEEIWRNVARVVPAALRSAGLTPTDIVALGIANQRETTVVWDRLTGVPLARAITWQDTRTDAVVARLVEDGHGPVITGRCGLAPATYFAGPRLRWLLDHVPGARERAEAGEVLFGTMESWLIWRLTGRHVTDVTNASRTMLMDLRTVQWSDELLDVLAVPRAMLPEIRSNAEVYGTCTSVLPGVPVAGALGDQQAALVGQACFSPGEVKCTYGTGAFLLMNTGQHIAESTHGLIPTVGYLVGDIPVYALEGAIAVTGSLVQWFRDSLGMITTAAQIETLATSVPDNGGCYIVPAFSGLYSPRWHPDARGVMVGLTSYITRGHLARAVLEATGWQTREVVDAMNADSGVPVTRLKVDGGMTANHQLMQFVADVLDLPVERPLGSEAVSLGAAVRGGTGRRSLAGRGGATGELAPGGSMGAGDGRRAAPRRARLLGSRGGPQLRVGHPTERDDRC